MPAACLGSSLCSSLTLFQMFPQLHTWWAHGLCFATAAKQVCDTRGHVSSEPGGTPCLASIKMFSFSQFIRHWQRCS